MRVNSKSENIRNSIKNFFKELRFLLKTRENQLLEEFNQKYIQEFDTKVEVYDNSMDQIRKKISNWTKE